MHAFYSAAAQVLPVLVLAIVFEYRALTGSGPNVYEAFGLPVKTTAAPGWFLPSFLAVLILMPASLFAAEFAALRALSLDSPGDATCFWTVGGLVIGGVFVLLPFVLEGFRRTFPKHEFGIGERTRLFFPLAAAALVTYWVAGVALFAL